MLIMTIFYYVMYLNAECCLELSIDILVLIPTSFCAESEFIKLQVLSPIGIPSKSSPICQAQVSLNCSFCLYVLLMVLVGLIRSLLSLLLYHAGKATCLKFGPDAKYIAVGSMDRNLRIFGLPEEDQSES